MFSVLYTHFDIIYKIGPFDSQEKAIAAAKEANTNNEFDIDDQRVYLLHPDHKLEELDENFVVTD